MNEATGKIIRIANAKYFEKEFKDKGGTKIVVNEK